MAYFSLLSFLITVLFAQLSYQYVIKDSLQFTQPSKSDSQIERRVKRQQCGCSNQSPSCMCAQLPQLCRCNPTMPCPCASPQSDPLAQCMPICQRSCSSSCLQQNLPLEECQSTCAITCQQACSKYQRLSGLINGQASNVQALQSRSVQSICAPKCQQTCLAVCFGRNFPRAKCEQTCQRTCAEVCSKQPNLVLSASEAEVFSGAPQVSQASPPIQESLIAPQKQCVPACMPACLPECTGEMERRSTVANENPSVVSVSGQLTSGSADSAQNQRCVDQCFSSCIDVCVQARQPLHGCLSGCSAECGNKCGVQLSGSSPQQQITRPEVIFQMPEVGQLEPRQQLSAVQQTQYQYQPEATLQQAQMPSTSVQQPEVVGEQQMQPQMQMLPSSQVQNQQYLTGGVQQHPQMTATGYQTQTQILTGYQPTQPQQQVIFERAQQPQPEPQRTVIMEPIYPTSQVSQQISSTVQQPQQQVESVFLRPQMSQTNAQTGLTMPQPQTLSVQQSVSNQPESQIIYTRPQSAASILEPGQQYPQSQVETVYARSETAQSIPQPQTIISQRQVTSVGSQPQSELSMPQQSQIISAEQLQSQHPSILSYAPERQPMQYSGSIQQPQQQQQMQIQAPTIQEYSSSQFVHSGAASMQQAEIKCPPGSCPQAPCPCGNNRISEQESQSLQRNQQLNQQQYQYQQQAPTQLSVNSISPQQGQSSPQLEVLQSVGSQPTSTSFASQQCQQTCQMKCYQSCQYQQQQQAQASTSQQQTLGECQRLCPQACANECTQRSIQQVVPEPQVQSVVPQPTQTILTPTVQPLQNRQTLQTSSILASTSESSQQQQRCLPYCHEACQKTCVADDKTPYECAQLCQVECSQACNQAVSSQNSAPVTTSLPQNVASSGSVYPVQIIPEAITAPTSSSSTFNVRQPIYSGCPSCEQQTLQQRPPRPETFNVQQTQQPAAMVTSTRQESVPQMMPQVSQVSQVMPPPTPTKRCDKSCNGVCLSQCSQKKLPSKVCKPACNQQCSKVCKRK